MTRILVATRNRHKVREIAEMLGAGVDCVDLGAFSGAPEVTEDGVTFEANARKKSVEIAGWIVRQGRGVEVDFVLADDSGLEVDALDGKPGVHSARFAALDTGQGGNSSDSDNNAKLLDLLKELASNQRTARFRCVLALTSVGSGNGALRTRCFEGACEGQIGFEPRGEHGFGYDPLFVPDGHDCTFAELGDEVKNRISHRSQALERLKSALAELA